MRVIEVEKCGRDECPWCIPSSSNKNVNYCGAYATHHPEIKANIKTFPHICPLTKAAVEEGKVTKHECDWVEDEEGNWFTGCGNASTFNDGGPSENGAKFCAYCGARLIATRYEQL